MKKVSIAIGVALGALFFFFSSSVYADECEGDCGPAPSASDFGGGRQISGAIDASGSRVFFESEMGMIPVSLPQSIANRAQVNGMVSFPINRLSLVKIIKRYELAQMIIAFHKNIKMKTITYRDLCDYHNFNDHRGFTTNMQSGIPEICSLGVMGWGLDRQLHDILLPAFRPLDKLTTYEMAIAFHRYFGLRSDLPRSLTRADILRFLYNHR